MAPLTFRRRLQSERGAELVEMALVLPLLLLMLVGIVDFGFLFREFSIATNAAREGARTAILPGYVDADVRSRVQVYLRGAGLGSGIVCDSADCEVKIDPETMTVGLDVINLRAVQVTVYHHFTFLDPISRLVGGSFSTIPVSGRAVMRLE